jgi:hypothetical protein
MWLPYVEYHLRPLPGFALVQPWLEAAAVRQWRRTRRPPPPRSVKATLIRSWTARSRNVFVESGTFFGDMLVAVRPDFARLYSIELSPTLAARARRRFAGDPAIEILHGDSSAALGPLLRSIAAPAVLWLDGHYSGWLTARGETDTPIWSELRAAVDAGTPDDALLIDDARLFGRHPAYPAVDEVTAFLRERRHEWETGVTDDVLWAGLR